MEQNRSWLILFKDWRLALFYQQCPSETQTRVEPITDQQDRLLEPFLPEQGDGNSPLSPKATKTASTARLWRKPV